MLVNGGIPLDQSRKPIMLSHIESLNDALGGLLDCLRTNATHLDVLLRVVWRLGRMVEDVVVVRPWRFIVGRGECSNKATGRNID